MEETTDTVQIDLNGEYRYKVDAKGRVSLPAKFRKVLPSDLVVTLDPGSEYLMVFTSEGFNQWVKEEMDYITTKKEMTRKQHLDYLRSFKKRAKDVQIDTAGRIVIPADQRDAAAIEKDAVIVGMEGYFEMWDAKRYDANEGDCDLTLALL